MIKIGFDLMGGDYAPEESVKGLHEFLVKNNSQDVKVVVFAHLKAVEKLIKEYELEKIASIELVDCAETIEMSEEPVKALISKKNSSIVVGLNALKRGEIDVFSSAGNSGAIIAGALSILGTIKGITRPAFLLQYTKTTGKESVILDVGGNVDCKPQHLLDFAFIGTVYAKTICGIEEPTVALLNIGEEPTKGSALYKEAYKLISTEKSIKFVGNIESRYIFNSSSDVIVCDGFTGNILLKFAEGIYDVFNVMNTRHAFVNNLNYALRGGTPVVGINGNVIVGHGISNKTAFESMLNLSKKIAEQNLAQKINSFFEKIRRENGPSAR